MKLLPEKNIHYVCSVPLSPLSQGFHFPVDLFTFYYRTCMNFSNFFHRHFVLVYVAESMTGLSGNAFNTQGIICIWPWPISLGTLWRR